MEKTRKREKERERCCKRKHFKWIELPSDTFKCICPNGLPVVPASLRLCKDVRVWESVTTRTAIARQVDVAVRGQTQGRPDTKAGSTPWQQQQLLLLQLQHI